MSEAITQLFGKYLGSWIWYTLVLSAMILGKLSTAWACLAKKGKEKPKSTEVTKSKKEENIKNKDIVEVKINGRLVPLERTEAISLGLLKEAT